MKLMLDFNEVLNGDFEPGSFNLLMAFQVNCPGCFVHGFPLMMELQNHYSGSLSCFALATAFEDFHLNTPENARLLAEKGDFVGETLKAQHEGLIPRGGTPLPFPILLDTIVPREELTHPQFIDGIIKNSLQHLIKEDGENIAASLLNYFNQQPKCGKTFASNLMRGTPSFFLFNKSMEILVQWFGHANSHAVIKELDIFIGKKHG